MMGTDDREGVQMVNLDYDECDIVEVAPYTEYIGCTFLGSVFVGTGPADFIDCRFEGCSPRRLPKVTVRQSNG